MLKRWFLHSLLAIMCTFDRLRKNSQFHHSHSLVPTGVEFNSEKKFETKHQMLHRLQEGLSFGDGMDYNIAEYQAVASLRAKNWKAVHYPDHDLLSRHATTSTATADRKLFTPENIERDYWDIVEMSKEVAVEYGNDVDTHIFGSGFPLSERGRSIYGTKNLEKLDHPEPEFGTEDYYKETWWNLNNIPSAPDSVLRHVKVGINGINVPWMYHGSLFTTFCWHNEDNHLYSINYHHKGAPKQWYGVPGAKEAAEGLEKVFKSYLSMKMRDVPDLLHHITTMFSPRLLQNADVPVYKTLQYEGEFVITFPRAFHGGFSMGPNIGEAVNFATHDWIAYGSDANERYRSFARPAVFSHDRLTFTMANHLEDQKSYSTCKRLLDELERVVNEEMRLRHKLQLTGVRDVSNIISLPKNRLDQLDERSANYDDRRVCHGCKHVCFFSAVACECSRTKVSCLRHSHFMCRCPTGQRYFMIWSTNEELKATLERVREHCESLRQREASRDGSAGQSEMPDVVASANEGPKLSDIAPGVEQDLERHKNDQIRTDPITRESFMTSVKTEPNRSEEGVTSSVAVDSDDTVVVAAASAVSVGADEGSVATTRTSPTASPLAVAKGSASAVLISSDEGSAATTQTTRTAPPLPVSKGAASGDTPYDDAVLVVGVESTVANAAAAGDTTDVAAVAVSGKRADA
jgi:JmjC domain, hydroxylase/C5HC2 zinc finger